MEASNKQSHGLVPGSLCVHWFHGPTSDPFPSTQIYSWRGHPGNWLNLLICSFVYRVRAIVVGKAKW